MNPPIMAATAAIIHLWAAMAEWSKRLLRYREIPRLNLSADVCRLFADQS